MLNSPNREYEYWQSAGSKLLVEFVSARAFEGNLTDRLIELGFGHDPETTRNNATAIAARIRKAVRKTFEQELVHGCWQPIYRRICTAGQEQLSDAKLAAMLGVDRATLGRWDKSRHPVQLAKFLMAIWIAGLDLGAIHNQETLPAAVFAGCRAAVHFCDSLTSNTTSKRWSHGEPTAEEMLCLYYILRAPSAMRERPDEGAAFIAAQIDSSGFISNPVIRSADAIRRVCKAYGEPWCLFESTIPCELF
jgi:hypothetical protein